MIRYTQSTSIVLILTAMLSACATESQKTLTEIVPPAAELSPVVSEPGSSESAREPEVPAEPEPSAPKPVPVEVAPDVQPTVYVPQLKENGLPPAQTVLEMARAQLPPHPVQLTGTLKERAANGFVKKNLSVEMNLHWGASPSQASYQIKNKKTGSRQVLDIRWLPGGPEFMQDGVILTDFNPNTEIESLGITWADLSFSFLWHYDAQIKGTGKKMGKACYILSVPRPAGELVLWIEKKTGRLLGAEERDGAGQRKKIIKVVSIKEFDGLWMVKDLDIIIPSKGGKTSLRIDEVKEEK